LSTLALTKGIKMNAYELANQLEVFMHSQLDQVSKLHLDAAALLRLQTDEITALRKQLNDSQTERA
jgi:hypothetical protein